MSGGSIYGFSKQFLREPTTYQTDTLTLNTTKVVPLLVVPVGFGPIRIEKVSWAATAILAQAGGTSTVQIQVGAPGALRTIVAATTVLGGVANTLADFALAAETALKEQTVDEGGIVLMTLAVSNNALGTNGGLVVQVTWHPIPDEKAGDEVKHQGFYRLL